MATRLDVVGIGNAMVDAIISSNKEEVTGNDFPRYGICYSSTAKHLLQKKMYPMFLV